MKDHVEIGHLTAESAFRASRDQAMNLEICNIWFKIHTNVSNLNRALIRRTVKRAGPSKKV